MKWTDEHVWVCLSVSITLRVYYGACVMFQPSQMGWNDNANALYAEAVPILIRNDIVKLELYYF